MHSSIGVGCFEHHWCGIVSTCSGASLSVCSHISLKTFVAAGTSLRWQKAWGLGPPYGLMRTMAPQRGVAVGALVSDQYRRRGERHCSRWQAQRLSEQSHIAGSMCEPCIADGKCYAYVVNCLYQHVRCQHYRLQCNIIPIHIEASAVTNFECATSPLIVEAVHVTGISPVSFYVQFLL